MKKYEKPKLEEEIIDLIDICVESSQQNTVDGDSVDFKVGE